MLPLALLVPPRVPTEIGMQDGFGIDDFGFWVSVIGGMFGAIVAIATVGALFIRPLREANARDRREAERRETLDRDLYGSPARPGRDAEPGLLEDVRHLKGDVAHLTRDVERIADALGVSEDKEKS